MRSGVKRAAGGLALAGGVVGGVVALRPGTRGNKVVHHELDAAGRRLRHLGGRLRGARYRLGGRHPDPDVIDNVLADRIRSSLGGLEKRLDLPRVHVMVEHHVAMLHGEVATEADVAEIERAVAGVSGVTGVESYLHVGLIRGDTRPSEGRVGHPASEALERLLDAAVAAGVPEDVAPPVVRGILATFAERIPLGQRDHVASHLPEDVRALFTPPRRTQPAARPRTVDDLVARIVAATAELPGEKAEEVTSAVIAAFRSLVPDEALDVAAVLPEELRALWER